MPRRGFVPKREVLPDPVYGTTVVTKLINQIMLDGKRGIAQNVCYNAFETVAEKTGKDANEVFQAALNNVAPQLEVKARRVGGASECVFGSDSRFFHQKCPSLWKAGE